MRDVGFTKPAPNLRTASFRACLASILELALEEVPQAVKTGDPATDPIVARWLAGFALGLAPIVDPDTFEWGGPWLARVRPTGGDARFVVMYGHPSGVVWDPAHGGAIEREWIDAGFVVAAADIATARPAPPPLPTGSGVVEAIGIAPTRRGTGAQLEPRAGARRTRTRGRPAHRWQGHLPDRATGQRPHADRSRSLRFVRPAARS